MNFKKLKSTLEERMKQLKSEIGALYYAYKNKDTPIYAKIVVAIIVAYALSPIDFIPDFIPVLGYLDDVILLPMGIALAIRLIPEDIMNASRIKAQAFFDKNQSKNWVVAILIIVIWAIIAILFIRAIIGL